MTKDTEKVKLSIIKEKVDTLLYRLDNDEVIFKTSDDNQWDKINLLSKRLSDDEAIFKISDNKQLKEINLLSARLNNDEVKFATSDDKQSEISKENTHGIDNLKTEIKNIKAVIVQTQKDSEHYHESALRSMDNHLENITVIASALAAFLIFFDYRTKGKMEKKAEEVVAETQSKIISECSGNKVLQKLFYKTMIENDEFIKNIGKPQETKRNDF